MTEADLRKYLTYGFFAVAAVSIFMFVRAASERFSENVALCLTRGGESCFNTSNPVWTAENLRWLSPIILILAALGFVGLALIQDTFFGIGSAVLTLFLIVSISLNAEIKNKEDFFNPAPLPPSTVYVPSPSNGGITAFDQNEIENQLEEARESACRAADDIQYQWVRLNSQIQQLRVNSDGSFESDSMLQQLQMQVFQLQQQESNLRSQCIG